MTLQTGQTVLLAHSAPARIERSPGNLDTIKSLYDGYARRDLNAIMAAVHPDVEIYQCELLPWGGHYNGREGLQLFLGRLMAAIETEFVQEALMEAGDRVINFGRTRGRALTSGRTFDLPAVHVYQMADGLARRCEAYVDTPGMLRALGQ